MPRKMGKNARMNLDRLIVDDDGFTNVYIGGYTVYPETGAVNGYGVYWGHHHYTYVFIFSFN